MAIDEVLDSTSASLGVEVTADGVCVLSGGAGAFAKSPSVLKDLSF